ncbi:DUF2294 domain-containing protein [Metabacillus flavus]|uniref:DUF2294 domain-containing protein n=1 Tax=Metabacillus flavus TaxID=2823519 RepID=UPI003266756D
MGEGILGKRSSSSENKHLGTCSHCGAEGVLTPAEQKLSETESGLLSVKKIRAELVESGADELKQIVSSATGVEIMSFHTDISTRTGERVMVFLTEGNEKRETFKKP